MRRHNCKHRHCHGVQGTAVAMETADVSLMDNDLRKIAFGICLGRQVTSVIFKCRLCNDASLHDHFSCVGFVPIVAGDCC